MDKQVFSVDDSLLDMVNKALQTIKSLEQEDGLTDEEINIKYISGFCGFLAEDIKTIIELFCKEHNLKKPSIKVVDYDLDVGPHSYIKIPNPNRSLSATLISPQSYLYADIDGIHTYEEMLKRNKSTMFAIANNKVNTGKISREVISKQRHKKIVANFYDCLLSKQHKKEVK